jgi:polyphenol oxidase
MSSLEPITADCLADIKGTRHGFFGRQGGISRDIYASLNCGYGSKDAAEAVAENRNRVAAHLATNSAHLLTCYQIHSPEAVIVTEPWTRDAMPKADGLATRVPGIALGALAADCAPVLFADPHSRVVGAAHAGWKGALGGVLERTVAAMESLGASRSRIRAVLGPCIGPGAYEVGPEFEAVFISANPANAGFFRRENASARPHFDLPGFVLARLGHIGLDTVESCTECTYSNPDKFFSYRRSTHHQEADYGRQISAIILS